MKQIQIPLGMKDTLYENSRKKEELKQRIENVFASYGYQEISTPSIEFYQTYQEAFSQLDNQQLFKFIDQDGQILCLRMDMTVPIARVCASKLSNLQPPYRIRYCSDVFKVRQAFAGKSSEVTDCGVELVGLDSSMDLEVLSCAIDTMESLQVKGYQLEIGNSDYFKAACQYIGLDNEVQLKLSQLIDTKSMVELKEYLQTLELEQNVFDFFMALPLLNGNQDILDTALEVSFIQEQRDEIQALKELYQKLDELGLAKNILFDLGKVPHLDYYTGIIFEGFVDGVGHSVLSGGRYDTLLSTFGRDLPACGFSVKLDYLLESVQTQTQPISEIHYPKSKEMEAFKLAQQLRQTQRVILVPDEQKEEIEVVR